jgi:hypothetical protein
MPIIVPIGTGTSVGTGVTTYSGLVASVQSWLNRSDLTAKVPDFIALLEARLNRELRVPDMEEVTTLVLTDGAVDLPTDFLEARHLYINGATDYDLTPKPLSVFRSLYPTMTGCHPTIYAVADGQITVAPSSDDTLTLHYYQKLNPLSADNETNWLIVSHPDVYLWGALVMAEAFLWDDERVPGWKSLWDEAIGSLEKHGTKKRNGGGPLHPVHTGP